MKQFKDLGVPAVNTKGFKGDKIKIAKILNRPVEVHDFKIEPSRFDKGDGSKCLHLQIVMSNTHYVVFTGSNALMETIQKVPKTEFPFATTIVKDDSDRFSFT